MPDPGGSRSGDRSHRDRVYAPEALLAAVSDPRWADATGDEVLVVELGGADGLAIRDQTRIATWLSELPVPVIGAGKADGGLLGQAVDVVASTAGEVSELTARIRANPLAAAVLVQVLRHTVTSSVPDGLVLESLGYGTLQSGSELRRWLGARNEAPRSAEPAEPVVLLDRRGDRLDIVLDSPRNRNALSAAMRDALTEAFCLVAMDDGIREVHVRGNGPCFSAGGDLTEFGTSRDAAAAHRIRLRRMPARYLAAAGDRYHFHLHGACIGAGIELPAFAGRLTAAPDAYFQLPEVAMGLIPGAGGCVSLPRRIGRQRTAWMALTGERVGARQALEWGLIDAIVR